MSRLLRSILPVGPTHPSATGPRYTIVYPPTMLWTNVQRPHNILTQLARRHDVRCLFNDWTVREERHEGGRLLVTRRAFRRRYHLGPLVYYYSIPEKLSYLRRYRLEPDLTVFELMDVPEREFASWQEGLPRALRHADIVRTTSGRITDYLRERYPDEIAGKTVRTSRNGVDLALFDPDRGYETPSELEGIEKPILGFYGNLDWWIDWGLMERLSRLPHVQVVVIGDTEGRRPRVPPTLRSSSILFLDRKPVTRLPAYLNRFDVALFPFVVNEMTDGVDALKLWEYLAFGKPVLATPTAFMREHAGLVHLLDHNDVADAVAAALASAGDPDRTAARRAAAAERDWGTIADELHSEIVEALGGTD